MADPQRIFLANGILRRALMTGGWLPLSIRIVVELDFSATQLLLMGTAIEAAILLVEVPTGVVADVFSRKWSVIIGGLLLGVAQFASGIVDQWVLFLVTQFVWGVGWTFLSGAEIAWVTDEVGSTTDVEPLLLRRGRLQLVATSIGIVVFGLLSFVSVAGAVMLAGGIGIIWNLWLMVAMSEHGFARSTENHWSTFVATMKQGAAFTWATRGLRVLGIALVAAGMAAEAIDRLGLRRLVDIGLSGETSPIAVLAVVMFAQSAIAALLLWRFEQRVAGRLVVAAFAALFGSVAVFTLALAGVPALVFSIVALIAVGALLDLSEPLIDTWTNALAPDDARATVHSFIGQTRALGEVLGGVVLGAVAGVFTLPTAWAVAGGLFGFAALVSWSGRRHWPAGGG